MRSCLAASHCGLCCSRSSRGSSRESARLRRPARHDGRHRRLWDVEGARRHNLSAYFRSDHVLGWATIGLSVMATQASAITFLSMPGQAYESGMGFVQNYFGLPIALIIVAAVFPADLPPAACLHGLRIPRPPVRPETRLLGAGLFLLQRGLPPASRSMPRPSSSRPCSAGGWMQPSSSPACS